MLLYRGMRSTIVKVGSEVVITLKM